MAVVQLSGAHNRLTTERPTGRRLILHVGSAPPIPSRRNGRPAENLEGVVRCVQLATNVELELIARLELSAEHVPFEIRRLPRRRAAEAVRTGGENVPTRNRREVQLATGPQDRSWE